MDEEDWRNGVSGWDGAWTGGEVDVDVDGWMDKKEGKLDFG